MSEHDPRPDPSSDNPDSLGGEPLTALGEDQVHPGDSVFDPDSTPDDDLSADADPSNPGGLDEGVVSGSDPDTLQMPAVESGQSTGGWTRARAWFREHGGPLRNVRLRGAAAPSTSGDVTPPTSSSAEAPEPAGTPRRRVIGTAVADLISSVRWRRPGSAQNSGDTDNGNVDTIEVADITEVTQARHRLRRGHTVKAGDRDVFMKDDDILSTYGYDPKTETQGKNPDAKRFEGLRERWNKAAESHADRQKRGIHTQGDFTDSTGEVDYNGWLDAARDDLARIKARSQFKIFGKGKVKAALKNYQEALVTHTALNLIKDQQDKGETYDDATLDTEAKKIAIEDAEKRSQLEKEHFMNSNKGKFLNWFGNQSIAKKVLIAAPVGVGIAAGSGVALAAAGGGLAAAGVGGLIGAAKFGRSKWRSNSRSARDEKLNEAEKFRAETEEGHISGADNAVDTSDTSLTEVDRTVQRITGIGNIVGESVEKLSKHERRQARISAGIGALAIVGGANVDRVVGFVDDQVGDTSVGEWVSERWRSITNLFGADSDHDGGSGSAREAASTAGEETPADSIEVPETVHPEDREAYVAFAEADLEHAEIMDILDNPDDEAFGRFVSWAETTKEQLSHDPAFADLSDADLENEVLDRFERFAEGLDPDQVSVGSGGSVTGEIAEVVPNLRPEQYYDIYEQLREAHGNDGIFDGVRTYVMPNGDLGVMPGEGHWAPGIREEIERLAYETSVQAAREAAEENAEDLAA